jgi:hypothetical protein
MFTEIIFTTMVAVVLYGLISLTEKVFAQRQQFVEKDARIIDHRSRM